MSLHAARLASLMAIVPALLLAERAAQAAFALMQLDPGASSEAPLVLPPSPVPPPPPARPAALQTGGDIIDPWQEPAKAPRPPPPVDPWSENPTASDPSTAMTLPDLVARSELVNPWQGQPALQSQDPPVRLASMDALMIDPWANVRPARTDFRLREIVDPWAQP